MMKREAIILEGTVKYDSYGHRSDQTNIDLKLVDKSAGWNELNLLEEITNFEDCNVRITIERLD